MENQMKNTATNFKSTEVNEQEKPNLTPVQEAHIIDLEFINENLLAQNIGQLIKPKLFPKNSLFRTNILGNDIVSMDGVSFKIRICLLDSDNKAVENAFVYIWHCDQNGSYSGYSSRENGFHYDKSFCRGVYQTNVNGKVQFQTIYPGWYPGSSPHIHLAIFPEGNLNSEPILYRVCLPEDVTKQVYNSYPYKFRKKLSSIEVDNSLSQENETSIQADITGDVCAGLLTSIIVNIP